MTTLLSLPHAAVEAGLGTLGLNLQLLTPEFGPRVLLTAVLCSVDVACDQKMETALCLGPSCGRCLKTCPADAVGHWTRDWPACDRFRSPHGFAQLSEHVTRIIAEPDAAQAERAGALRGQLQSLAKHPARRRRHHRLPPLRRCLSGRRRLRRDAERRARRDSGRYAGEGSARSPPWTAEEKAGHVPETYAEQSRWIGASAAARLLIVCLLAVRGSCTMTPLLDLPSRAPRLSASNPSARSVRSRKRAARRSTTASSIT